MSVAQKNITCIKVFLSLCLATLCLQSQIVIPWRNEWPFFLIRLDKFQPSLGLKELLSKHRLTCAFEKFCYFGTYINTFNKTFYMFQRFGISCSHFPFTLKLCCFCLGFFAFFFFSLINSVILTRVSFSF